MKNDVHITYGGRDMAGVPISAANAEEGWIVVVDKAMRYPGGGLPLINRERTDFIFHRLYGDVTIVINGHSFTKIDFNRRRRR